MKTFFVCFLTLLCIVQINAQVARRAAQVLKTEHAPKIDGILDEPEWKNAPPADNFTQFEPYNGKKPSYNTDVRILYTNDAIYIGAMLFDSKPDSISRIFGPRDSGFELNTDFFGVDILAYNDGQSSAMFGVSAAGVQTDIKITPTIEDNSWDAVWQSEVTINNEGWVVEMKIPYSALRFPKSEAQIWGFNLYRHISRFGEWSSWNYINNQINSIISQSGELKGINNITPPLRLSVTPYVSYYYENNQKTNSKGQQFKGGMDLKWGINESFTLDMILIPDFKQVQSDDHQLNLGPFEIRYDEKRSFFTEGTELFNKGNIFYSKRIGAQPTGYDNVSVNSNQKIVSNPLETQLLNATKVSGRTNFGLGVGIFNAITNRSEAVIEDILTGDKSYIETQATTNYNLLVFDQSLPSNSSVSLINTNVYNKNLMADVTALDFRLNNKKNTYSFAGRGSFSNVKEKNADRVTGYSHYVSFAKTGGNFLFGLSQNVESNNYNPNHMGYLQSPNEWAFAGNLAYRILEPFSIFRNVSFNMNSSYGMLFKPRAFTSSNIQTSVQATFKNYYSTVLYIGGQPLGGHEYFETRVEGRYFYQEPGTFLGFYLSSDERKQLSLEIDISRWTSVSEYNQQMISIEFEPTWRITDRISVSLENELGFRNNSLGYASHSNTDVYFGRRDIKELSNTLESIFIFNNKSMINLRARHYHSSAFYKEYYFLNLDGTLQANPENYTENADVTFNAITLDAGYTWRFAPGSELSVVWKSNAMTYNKAEGIKYRSYKENINYSLDAPYVNSLSFKLLYYLDYQVVRGLLK